MNSYMIILLLLLKGEYRTKYLSSVNTNFIKENYPDLHKLYIALQSIPEGLDASLDDLKLTYLSLYPNAKPSVFEALFQTLSSQVYSEEIAKEALERSYQREQALILAKEALKFSDGQNNIEQVRSCYQKILDGTETSNLEEPVFVSDDIELLHAEEQHIPGLLWPLSSLNEVLGPLRLGDFGFVFARPETGKTTFLVHSVTHMARQVSRPILWFNNEERGSKVMKRCYQAMFGINLTTLYSNLPKYKEKFQDLSKNNIKIYDKARITKKEVEDLCNQVNPSLIIFDQIDKIEGFDGERYDLMLKRLYQWARELAKTYGPVIAVCQAGGTGENKKWLTLNDVDSSHTAKQGEADWVLGIGRVDKEGLEEVRYLHVSKNKLDGDPSLTKEDRRHDKWEVLIKPEVGRYSDF